MMQSSNEKSLDEHTEPEGIFIFQLSEYYQVPKVNVKMKWKERERYAYWNFEMTQE